MAQTKNNNKNTDNNFEVTFKRFDDMTEAEKNAFKQGAYTANNQIKERLGLKKPRN